MAPVLPIAKASSLSILHLPQLVPPGACPSGWTPARAASTRRPRRGTGQRLAPLFLLSMLVRLRCTLVTSVDSVAPVHQNNSITTGVGRGARSRPLRRFTTLLCRVSTLSPSVATLWRARWC